MKEFLFGFTYPFRIIRFFFSHPVLIRYSIAPMMINLVIYGSVFFFTYKWLIGTLGNWIGVYTPDASIWIQFLHIILLVIGFLVLLFICYLLFTILGNLVTAPFNEEISQRVEEIVAKDVTGHKMGFWEDAFESIKGEAEKLLFYLFFLFLILLLNLIPLIGNVTSAIIGMVFSFFYNALDFLDYPMTRKKMKFRQKLRVTRSGKLLTYGFGCTAFLLMFLPVINVFMKPILVVAGTSLYYERGFDKLK